MTYSSHDSCAHEPVACPSALDKALPNIWLHKQIEEAMSVFGAGVLTVREQDVVRLILQGFPSKRVAGELKIALKTEKVHRRNAYAKLGVNSHAALFVQFLRFLSVSLASNTSTCVAADGGDTGAPLAVHACGEAAIPSVRTHAKTRDLSYR